MQGTLVIDGQNMYYIIPSGIFRSGKSTIWEMRYRSYYVGKKLKD